MQGPVKRTRVPKKLADVSSDTDDDMPELYHSEVDSSSSSDSDDEPVTKSWDNQDSPRTAAYWKRVWSVRDFLKLIHVECFFFHIPGTIAKGPDAGQPRAYHDLNTYKPQSARTWQLLCNTKQQIPLSCYYGNDKGEDSFYYFPLTLPQIFRFNISVHEEVRGLCSQILTDDPCHQYFDFDLSVKKDKEGVVIQESVVAYEAVRGREHEALQQWNEYWPIYFKELAGRELNRSVVQYEIASAPNKFSVHIHVVSDAFRNVDHHKEAVLQFAQWLSKKDKDSLVLQVMDKSVYTMHRNMRLVGSRKPKKHPLLIYDFNNKTTLPLERISEQHLFNGLINYAMAFDLKTQSIVECVQGKQAKKRRGALLDGEQPNKKEKRAGNECVRYEEISQALDRSDYDGIVYNDIDTKGYIKCSNHKGGRTCHFKDADGNLVFHERNRAWVRINDSGAVDWGCHSDTCAGKVMQLLGPTTHGNAAEQFPLDMTDGLAAVPAAVEQAAQVITDEHDANTTEALLDEALSKIKPDIVDNWDRMFKACVKASCTKEQIVRLTRNTPDAAERVDAAWNMYSALDQTELPRTHQPLMTILKAHVEDDLVVDRISLKLTGAKKRKPSTPPSKSKAKAVAPAPLIVSFNARFNSLRIAAELPWAELTAWWKDNLRAAYCPEFVDQHLVPFLNIYWKYVKDSALVYIKCEDRDGRSLLAPLPTDKFDKAYANFFLEGLPTKFPSDAGLACKFWFGHLHREQYDSASWASPYARPEHRPPPKHLSLFPALKIPHEVALRDGNPDSQDVRDYVQLINEGLLSEEPDPTTKMFYWQTVASQYARPGWLLYHGIAFAGYQKGAGKTYTVETALTELIGESLTAVQKQKSWFGEFNAPFEIAMSGMVDEYSHDQSMIKDIKYQVCAKRFTLRKMRCDPKPNQQSVTNLWWSCNASDEFDDELLVRRITCMLIGLGIQHNKWKQWLNRKWNWVDIAAYLLTKVDISKFDPEIEAQRPNTIGNQKQLGGSMDKRDPVAAWWRRMLENNTWEHFDKWVPTRAIYAAYLGPGTALTKTMVDKDMPVWLTKFKAHCGLTELPNKQRKSNKDIEAMLGQQVLNKCGKESCVQFPSVEECIKLFEECTKVTIERDEEEEEEEDKIDQE